MERPCLEEIEGFKEGFRSRGETPDLTAVLRWEQRLRDGKAIPDNIHPKAQWKYKKGRKPTFHRRIEYE